MSKTKLTEETICAVEQALIAGCSVKEACDYADIGESTYCLWNEKAEKARAAGKSSPYIEFLERVTRARVKAKPRLILLLNKGAEQDPRIALAILERRYPDEWGRKDKVDAKVEHSGGVKVVIDVIDDTPTDS